MFEQRRYRTTAASAIGMLELIHVETVRNLRAKHKSAVVGFVIDMLQTAALMLLFVVLFNLLGMRRSLIRGDFMLFIMTGIFLFRTHLKGANAIFGSNLAVSAAMLHARMNTIVAMVSAALAVVYQQTVTMFTILFLYHALFTPITIYDPLGAFAMFLLSWFSGCAIGLVFYSLKPWAPRAISMIKVIYLRANMLASGKMFVANAMPGFILQWFTWNPLFHTIDQARGFTFINYNPHYSSISYPVYLSLSLIMVGLLIEYFTRRRISISWAAQGV